MAPEAPGRGARCPICGRPAIEANRPFCSARCQRVDLGRWFGEAYRVPAAETDEDDDTAPPPAKPPRDPQP